jgi:hypothetical protein
MKGGWMSALADHFSKLTSYQIRNLLDCNAVQYREELLAKGEKYLDDKNLNRSEYEILSQCGEDGIIMEIFRRIGTTNRYFVEFGAGNGLQNSTAALLLNNWTGAWIEGDHTSAETIRNKFASLLLKHRLSFSESFITAENIEELFVSMEVPESFDCMSIDLDGNDFWVWKKITHYQPRVVVCEYNARYGGSLPWVMKYDPSHTWNGSCYYGAALKSFELLGAEKGYKLVGCNLAGVNAFFVREDLVEDHFQKPFTAERHFEPQRVFLIREKIQKNDFGPFELV